MLMLIVERKIPSWTFYIVVTLLFIVVIYTVVVAQNTNAHDCYRDVHYCQECNNCIGRVGDTVRA